MDEWMHPRDALAIAKDLQAKLRREVEQAALAQDDNTQGRLPQKVWRLAVVAVLTSIILAWLLLQ
jgi:hypothetical protein